MVFLHGLHVFLVLGTGDNLQNLECLRLPGRPLLGELVVVHLQSVQIAPLVPPTEAFVCPAVAFNLYRNYPSLRLTVLAWLEIPTQSR